MDIANVFKSKTRKTLFRLYFSNPESEYYLRELERILEIPVSMIRKELLRLEEDGIFISAKKGNLTYFYLNKSYPLFSELKSIVFKTIGIKGLLKAVLEKIKDIKTAFIYGSFAKNEESAKSDIDLFILDGPNGNGRSILFPMLKEVKGPFYCLIDDISHYPFMSELERSLKHDIIFKEIYGHEAYCLAKIMGHTQTFSKKKKLQEPHEIKSGKSLSVQREL